ncbi:MAG: tRNA pseudouridine(38-40) synthase TruA [Spirochaetes bacterium]|nr:tRNA pseudouridine(38-40) synthase TruA [Spirochaetota bacterium]
MIQKNRIALLIQYDGSQFNGWQVQKGGRTVQGAIETAVTILTKESPRVTASGRTDTGVHALGQVIHFDLEKQIENKNDLARLCISLNGILDPDVSVKNAYLVPADFHARFSTSLREYMYIIYNHPMRSPFIRHRAMWVREKLNEDYLQRTADLLRGEMDFASFCKKSSADINTVRRLDEIEIKRRRDIISVRILGNAFLHNMVRIIIGTLVEMHNEKRDPEYILEILGKKDRNSGGITAPPYGLYLNRVIYEPPLDKMTSAY